MPQMSPMPWILLFMLTIIILMYISSYIYFSLLKNEKNVLMKTKNNFSIKW